MTLFINAAHRRRRGLLRIVHACSPVTKMVRVSCSYTGPSVMERDEQRDGEKGRVEEEDKRRNGNLSLHTDLSLQAFLCSFPLTAAAWSYICVPAVNGLNK